MADSGPAPGPPASHDRRHEPHHRRIHARPRTGDHTLSANDLETLEALINKRQTRRDGWTLLIWAFAAVALFASAVAIGFGMRAIDESKRRGTGAVAPRGGATQVTLKEFSIAPR